MSIPPYGPPDPYQQGRPPQSPPPNAPHGPPPQGPPPNAPHGPPPGYPPGPPPGPPPQGPPQGPPPQGPPGPPSGPSRPPYGGRSPRKKGKGWIWLLSGGAFLLVVLIAGMFIGLNILSKNSQMSRDVVALHDRSSGGGPTHNSPTPQNSPPESPSEERSEPPSESPSPGQSRSNEPDDGGRYETGQCINAHSSLVAEVDCDEKHLAQIFYTEQLPNDEYPDKARFKSAAKRICPEHVKDAIDSGTVTKEFAVSFLRPTRSDWDEGDHNVYCLVARKDGKHFAGTKLLTQ